MPENWQSAGFGLYLHWPFCSAKCPYCDFNSHVVSSVDQDHWARAFVSEIERAAEETRGRMLSSVFFGGGTPSLMHPDTVGRIMESVRKAWIMSNSLEVTLEANPTSIEAGRFQGYRDSGVDRVSVGVQALDDRDLKRLGRLHSSQEALAALEIARNVFDRVSFDLIYARQHQTLESWQAELRLALDLEPEHLSLYQLTIEPGTAFGDRARRGKLDGLPNDDLGADMYLVTQEMMTAAGLPAYEISNHAKPGSESRHNLIYWRGGDYVGIGPGAHGRLTLNNLRTTTQTPLAPNAWLKRVEDWGNGEDPRQLLDPADDIMERLMMGLRLVNGLEWPLVHLAPEDVLSNNINTLIDEGILIQSDSHLRVAEDYRPVLNAVILRLMA